MKVGDNKSDMASTMSDAWTLLKVVSLIIIICGLNKTNIYLFDYHKHLKKVHLEVMVFPCVRISRV